MAARAIDARSMRRCAGVRRVARVGADLLELDPEALFDEAGGPCAEGLANRTERSLAGGLAGLLVHLLPFADMDKTAIYGLWRCLSANAGPADPICPDRVERGTPLIVALLEALPGVVETPSAVLLLDRLKLLVGKREKRGRKLG
jgi:hypothetical protein